MAKWWVLVNGEKKGPFSEKELVDQILSKEISVFDHISSEGGEKWSSVLEFEQFQFLVDQLNINIEPLNNKDEWILLKKRPPHRGCGFLQTGPYTTDQIHEKINQGELRLEDLIWKEGLRSWVKVREIDDFYMPNLSIESEALTDKKEISKIEDRNKTDEKADENTDKKTDEQTVEKIESSKEERINEISLNIDENDEEIDEFEKVSLNTSSTFLDESKEDDGEDENHLTPLIKIEGPEYVSKEPTNERPSEAEGEELVRKNIQEKMFTSQKKLELQKKIKESSASQKIKSKLSQARVPKMKSPQKPLYFDVFFDKINVIIDRILIFLRSSTTKKPLMFFGAGVFVISLIAILWYQKKQISTLKNKVTHLKGAQKKEVKKEAKKVNTSVKKNHDLKPAITQNPPPQRPTKAQLIEKVEPQVKPTKLSYWYLPKPHQLLVKTNGSTHFHLDVRLSSVLGKVLSVSPVRRYFRLKNSKNQIEFVLDLNRFKVPKGLYEVRLRSGELEKNYFIFLGQRNKDFKMSLWKINKKSSYFILTEKKKIFNATEKLEVLTEEAKKYYVKFKKSPKKWTSYYKSWVRQLKKTNMLEFENVSQLYFREQWSVLKGLRKNLFKEGEVMNKSIISKKYSTQGISRALLEVQSLQRNITSSKNIF